LAGRKENNKIYDYTPFFPFLIQQTSTAAKKPKERRGGRGQSGKKAMKNSSFLPHPNA
jgi:hypothetical protein